MIEINLTLNMGLYTANGNELIYNTNNYLFLLITVKKNFIQSFLKAGNITE